MNAYREALIGPAHILLLGTFGLSLALSLRRGEDFTGTMEKVMFAFLLLTFHTELLDLLQRLGQELEAFFAKLNRGETLSTYIASLSKPLAAEDTNPLTKSFNLMTQAFSTGVWALFGNLSHLIFVIAGHVLKVARDCVWQIISILAPLCIAVYPVAPRVTRGILIFALEVALWLPVLRIIDGATTHIAKTSLFTSETLQIITCELIAIILTFSVPSITHRIVSASIGGDLMGSWTKPLALASLGSSRLLYAGKKLRKAIGPVAIVAFLLPASVQAGNGTLQLHSGYVTKVICQGKLLVSAIGDDSLVRLEALPSDTGCGLLLQPLADTGRTNLLIETSSGTVVRIIDIQKRQSRQVGPNDLKVEVHP